MEYEIGFQKLKELAREAGCETTVQEYEEKANALVNQERIKLVVTGMRNSGKSTLINHMLENTVAEESMLSDEAELPLRVSFERMGDDPNYRCVTIVNPKWYEQSAILYELHARDVVRNGSLTPEMADKDVVLFMISAAAPFNSDEIAMLKALEPLSRQVILGGVDYVTGDLEKVLEYVKKINDSLGLPPVLVFENKSSQDIGRIVRNLLPADEAIRKMRGRHCDALFAQAVEATREDIKAAKQKTVAEMEALAESGRKMSDEAKREQAAWETLLTDARQRQTQAAAEVTSELAVEGQKIVQRIVESGRAAMFSEAWAGGIGKEVERIAVENFERRIGVLQKLYLRDLRKISSDAQFLKLDGYTPSDFQALEKNAPDHATVSSQIFTVMSGDTKGAKINGGEIGIILGTGVAVGAVALSPAHVLVKVLGGVALVAGGTELTRRQVLNEREAAVKMELGSWFQTYTTAMEKSLREASQLCYNGLLEFLQRGRDNVKTKSVDLTPLKEREVRLTNLLEACERLK